MTFLAPLFGAIGGAAAPAAAAAVPAVAGATTGGFSALSILSGAASVIGAFGQMQAANAQAENLNQQAKQVDLDAERESNLGMQRRTAIKRELLTVLGENEVNAAAAGIDLGAGIVQDMNQSAENTSAQELTIDRADQDYRTAQKRAQAHSLRSQASSVRKAGALSAFGGVLSSGLSMIG